VPTKRLRLQIQSSVQSVANSQSRLFLKSFCPQAASFQQKFLKPFYVGARTLQPHTPCRMAQQASLKSQSATQALAALSQLNHVPQRHPLHVESQHSSKPTQLRLQSQLPAAHGP